MTKYKNIKQNVAYTNSVMHYTSLHLISSL